MAMEKLKSFAPRTPFLKFICDFCGNDLGNHWQFRNEKMADVAHGPNARRPDGKLYCHSDQSGWAKSYHQRELKRTMVSGYREREYA